MRTHISGFPSNISLGLMLGQKTAFAAFSGLGLDVRRVTLSAGQIDAAAASLGPAALREPVLGWAAAAVPAIGEPDVGVNFRFAFRRPLRAHSVNGLDRARIRPAIRARMRSRPASFSLPSR